MIEQSNEQKLRAAVKRAALILGGADGEVVFDERNNRFKITIAPSVPISHMVTTHSVDVLDSKQLIAEIVKSIVDGVRQKDFLEWQNSNPEVEIVIVEHKTLTPLEKLEAASHIAALRTGASVGSVHFDINDKQYKVEISQLQLMVQSYAAEFLEDDISSIADLAQSLEEDINEAREPFWGAEWKPGNDA